jgi:hypothetical protein
MPLHTLIVNVARSRDAEGFARGLLASVAGTLFSTVARKRVWVRS